MHLDRECLDKIRDLADSLTVLPQNLFFKAFNIQMQQWSKMQQVLRTPENSLFLHIK